MRPRFSLVTAVLALTVLGCSAGPAVPAAPKEGDFVAHLRRPWAMERLRAGAPCPVTNVTRRPDEALGEIQGEGQAGPVGLGADTHMEYVAPDPKRQWADPGWAAQKVAWAVDPAVTTPVLVRGRRLDGPEGLRFGDPAAEELVLDPAEDALPGGWRDHPSLTRLRAPGCYAYQVDMAKGSLTIVFRAVGPMVAPAGG